jgi:hypothetical protein
VGKGAGICRIGNAMCGDDEEEASEVEELIYSRFLTHARALLEPSSVDAKAAPSYAEKLFIDALSRCVKDGAEGGYQRLAVQPLTLARLAGLLAGHLGLDRDPLRKVIEALLLGYDEAQAQQAEHDHDHDHDHEHGHHH